MKKNKEAKNIKVKWSNFDKFWLVFATLVVTLISVITKSTILNIIMSLTGVIYVILIAKQNRLAYPFGIINVIIYAYIMYKNTMYGSAIYNLFYSVPMLIYGYIYFNKQKDDLKINEMDKNKRYLFCLIILLILSIYILLMGNIFQMKNIIVDSIATVVGAFGMYLLAKQYIEQWYAWLIVNMTNLIYFLTLSLKSKENFPIVFMWVIYFTNSMFGLYKWEKKLKNKKIAN